MFFTRLCHASSGNGSSSSSFSLAKDEEKTKTEKLASYYRRNLKIYNIEPF
jgi:hypothetical protein